MTSTFDVVEGEPRVPAVHPDDLPAVLGVPIVGIGASAGGLEALRIMLSPARLPLGLALVVVQHLDPNHESMLAQLLDRQTALEVLQCEGGERLEADKVYIIPPGRGLAIRDGVLELTDFTQPRGLRRPIDDFFVSLAGDQHANAACVILSGTGADGSTGLRAVKENGGVCVVQQPESARYDGMPLSAVGTGLVDFVKPPADILDCLRSFFARRAGEPAEVEGDLVADHLDEVCRVLRSTVGHDFSSYKRSTLVRRVERRMHVLGAASGRAYIGRLRSDKDECEALFRDLLINVTRFFRDPELFEVLRTKAIEPLVAAAGEDEDIRVWAPGCSSGEEAYSLAMLFAEAVRQSGRQVGVQIFATDIDEQMLQTAREGSYPSAALADIPKPLRERYAVAHGDRFTVAAEIRDLIRFSSHSLVKDPPFSRVDLLSCRNLLIYFDDRLQQSVLPLLHYAIRPGGFLFLGPSESLGRFEPLFPVVDPRARLFERGPGAPNYPIDIPGGRSVLAPRRGEADDRSSAAKAADETAAVRRLMDQYTPPSMVVDPDGAILSAYGRLGLYFEFPVTRSGGSSAISLARPGLRNILGPLLRRTREARKRLVAREVEVISDFGRQLVEVICDPLADGTLLFVFRDAAPFRPSDGTELAELRPGDDHLDLLEDELRLTRYRLRSTVEELETTNEELKSSNEEMMSMNEELQSTNEELSTVNDELKSKVDQLTIANSDLRNFFESTDSAVIVLDRALRIRSFTEAATAIFPLQGGDRGRALEEVASRLTDTGFLEDAAAVAKGAGPIQRRVSERGGERTFSLRILPYRTQSGLVDGVTLVLVDITGALSLETALAAERERLDLSIRAAGIAVWEYLPETGEATTDPIGRAMFGIEAPRFAMDRFIALLAEGERAGVQADLDRASRGEQDFEMDLPLHRPGLEPRWVRAYGRLAPGREPRRVVGVALDVTAEHMATETRELMLREMNHRVKNLFAVVAGIVSLGARTHKDTASFSHDVRERIASLGRAHTLASARREQQAVPLRSLLEVMLEPYARDRTVEIEGPNSSVTASALSSLALILHEWATNSAKYGALAAPDGRLSVRWTAGGDGLVIDWRETGGLGSGVEGPAPEGGGFGTLLVESSARQLQASVSRRLQAGLFEVQLRLPARVIHRD